MQLPGLVAWRFPKAVTSTLEGISLGKNFQVHGVGLGFKQATLNPKT